MDEQTPPIEEKPTRNVVWRLVAYFIGLFVFGRLTMVLFAYLAGVPALQGFAKFNQIIANTLDVVRDMDAVIVTVWSLFLAFILASA